MKDKVNQLENTVADLSNKVEGMKADQFEQLDKVVRALVRKVLSLECELEEVIKNSMQRKVVEENDESTKVKEKEIDKVNEFSVHFDDIKDACSTPKEKEEKDETDNEPYSKIKCTICNYVCKKETTLKKHITAKHEEHQCKKCNVNLSSFMELLKHIARNIVKMRRSKD